MIETIESGEYWQHQRPVDWTPDFPEVCIQVGHSQLFTVEELSAQDVERIEGAVVRGTTGCYLPPEEAGRADENDGETYVPAEVDRRHLVERQIRERRGQQGFRDALRKRYGDCCLVTGCRALAVLEAAHIKPYRGEEDNNPQNGLLLRSDVHILFDLDLLGIEPEGLQIELNPDIAEDYGDLDGKTLGCTPDRQPSRQALNLRYEQFRQRVHRPA